MTMNEDYLVHYGVQDMHWHERRYQNYDGSLTEEGRIHYGVGPARAAADKISNTAKRASNAISNAARKKFKPTEADLDEKIQKETEKQRLKESIANKKRELEILKEREKNAPREAEIERQLALAYERKKLVDKQNELAELLDYTNPKVEKPEKFGKKNINKMTDEEVREEINSRTQRMKLEQMRKDDSALKKGMDFASKTTDIVTKPISVIGKAGADLALGSAEYWVKNSIKSWLDDSISEASKQRKLENRTESEILKDKAADAKNQSTIDNYESDKRMKELRERDEREILEAAHRNRYLKERDERERLVYDSQARKQKAAYDKLKSEADMRELQGKDALRPIKEATERKKSAYERAKYEDDIRELASKASLREAREASEKTKAYKEAAVNFMQTQVLMGSEPSSVYAQERLQRMPKSK